jgi:hypothetical protein
MKMAVFWFVAPCSMGKDYRRFRSAFSITSATITALMMELESTCETSVNFKQTTRHNSPEDSHLV